MVRSAHENFVTLDGVETITNKTIDGNNNTLLNFSSNHNLLSSTHTDSATATIVKGDMIIAKDNVGVVEWDRLAAAGAWAMLLNNALGDAPVWSVGITFDDSTDTLAVGGHLTLLGTAEPTKNHIIQMGGTINNDQDYKSVKVTTAHTPTVTGRDLVGFDFEASLNGTENVGHASAFQARQDMLGSGTLDRWEGMNIPAWVNNGTITEFYGLTIRPVVTGSGTIGTAYGIRIINLDALATGSNFAIHVANDHQCRFGGKVDIVNDGTTQKAECIITHYNDTGANRPQLKIRRGRGTSTSITDLVDTDPVGTIDFQARINSDFRNVFRVQAEADGTISASSYATKVIIQTVKDGETALTDRITLKSDGGLDFNSNVVTNLAIRRAVQIVVVDFGTATSAGDDKFYFHIDSSLAGTNLIDVHAEVIVAGTTNETIIQIHNVTQTTDMLNSGTGRLSIDSGETGSDTAVNPAIIDTANDDVALNDVIRIDVDQVSSTPATGLIITLGFRTP